MSDEAAGCLYDGSAEVQVLEPGELEYVLALAEEDEAEKAGPGFRVITNIRSQNFSRDRQMQGPFGIVLHHTGGSFAGDLPTLTRPASNPDNSVSANDYITKDGRIFELCEFPKRAWHAGKADLHGITDWNTHGWGIEIENRGTGSDPYPRAQIEAIVWRCRERRRRLGVNEPRMLVRHRDVCLPRGRKSDTSNPFPFEAVKRRIFAAADPTDSGIAPPSEEVTPNSKLLNAARVGIARVQEHMTARPHGGYSDQTVREIGTLYFQISRPVGLDPLLAVAQMVLETGNLSSRWSQPPHRNPAGIGVTGEPGVGVSFPDWRTAVRAHVGRLLAYAIPGGQGTAEQRELIQEALAVRPLPAEFRGVAPTLKGLVGRWATDERYAVKISRIANEIRR